MQVRRLVTRDQDGEAAKVVVGSRRRKRTAGATGLDEGERGGWVTTNVTFDAELDLRRGIERARIGKLNFDLPPTRLGAVNGATTVERDEYESALVVELAGLQREGALVVRMVARHDGVRVGRVERGAIVARGLQTIGAAMASKRRAQEKQEAISTTHDDDSSNDHRARNAPRGGEPGVVCRYAINSGARTIASGRQYHSGW